MSTDYDAVCDTCRMYRHVGQHMAGFSSFGYGSKDEVGRSAAATFCFNHAEHGRGVRIIVSGVPPLSDEMAGYKNDDDT